LNPRTRAWELPQGKVKISEAIVLIVISSLIFLYAAYQINVICFVLAPVALAVIFFYSLTKRFTWTSHLFLGLALSLAPMGAWLAVSGLPIDLDELKTPLFLGLAVLFWLAGFDVIYSLQDFDFDRQQGLHSIPVHFGIAGALQLSGLFHCGTVLFLAMVGLSAELGIVYWIGFIAVFAVVVFLSGCASFQAGSHVEAGRKAFLIGNNEAAFGYFQRAAELDPTYVYGVALRQNIWSYVGRSAYSTGNFSQARNSLEKSL